MPDDQKNKLIEEIKQFLDALKSEPKGGENEEKISYLKNCKMLSEKAEKIIQQTPIVKSNDDLLSKADAVMETVRNEIFKIVCEAVVTDCESHFDNLEEWGLYLDFAIDWLVVNFYISKHNDLQGR